MQGLTLVQRSPSVLHEPQNLPVKGIATHTKPVPGDGEAVLSRVRRQGEHLTHIMKDGVFYKRPPAP